MNRWKREQRDAEPISSPNPAMAKQLARLRKENEILRQERDLLKKATAFNVLDQDFTCDGPDQKWGADIS